MSIKVINKAVILSFNMPYVKSEYNTCHKVCYFHWCIVKQNQNNHKLEKINEKYKKILKVKT